jgi:hypothetical protein
VDELTGVRPNRLERFGTPERFGDGARSARARMARVNLTLSANREFDQIAWSDLGRRSALGTAREARGQGWPESISLSPPIAERSGGRAA